MECIKKSDKFFNKKGSMMVEVIVVAAVIAVAFLAAFTVAQRSIYISRQSLHQTQASFLLEEGAEATRIIRDDAWSSISGLTLDTDYYLSFSSGVWSLSNTPSNIDIFSRAIVLSSVYRDGNQDIASAGTLDNQTKLVTITVSWMEGGDTIVRTLKFYIMDLFS